MGAILGKSWRSWRTGHLKSSRNRNRNKAVEMIYVKAGLSPEDASFLAGFTEEQTKKMCPQGWGIVMTLTFSLTSSAGACHLLFLGSCALSSPPPSSPPKSAEIEDHIGLCFFAVVLACIGFYPILPATNAWTLNNLAGERKRRKRSIGIAFMISLGNCGGIPGIVHLP
ncbi:hypothetical protein PAAG_00161 [Paracoccidioides lutzii Pb01]|uniref:Uncharacterized protein n=1 Tax=Paracoccidioides lutzii (strain ATCC MYA-826 / Pb01) TaxID=502779 RepID=C1GNR6_PARBA|nr:hypothetical protein PAAG_00161 [Paracoccidioides lutzii Pb01]EEH35838.2 hypothetical protein PAAG_00161 [Paracoccidioides lutzii Pb01]